MTLRDDHGTPLRPQEFLAGPLERRAFGEQVRALLERRGLSVRLEYPARRGLLVVFCGHPYGLERRASFSVGVGGYAYTGAGNPCLPSDVASYLLGRCRSRRAG